ncbi:hypothetical protein JTE90_021170 [Oedothorax gibbosus]|uniref:Uncharacterized protein n=1 Tax=Oedothorax gibbosus TaxID=931172 RepID=A0AAV6V4A5_9ARAC|nr:hypothetical protein JTE90_021170 [Oedothorax gibbosus]
MVSFAAAKDMQEDALSFPIFLNYSKSKNLSVFTCARLHDTLHWNMGNTEMHQLEPVRDDERKELDLSTPTDYAMYIKHIRGEYSHKCLSEVPSAITDSISLHERVNLSFNCITYLPVELPLRIPHICFLDLSYNRISALPNCIGLLFHLKELLLPHNCLTEIPVNTTRLVKLQKIDLSHNSLQELPNKIGDMESLKKLNVSNNKLKSLPKSLGCSTTIEILLAVSNNCESQPPQNVCDAGSDATIRFLKQLVSGKILPKPDQLGNVFPRVRGNVTQTSTNSDSARAQYVQIQTATMNTASRIRTPLLPPYDAMQLHPEKLKDKIIGILYGAVIGDALGTATEFLSKDECQFHYNEETFTYADIIRDEHRAHWTRGDWTSNSDQMLLVLESLLHWAGVVDELEFAKRLVIWKKSGFPELGTRENYIFSTTINLVLQSEKYSSNPHQVAENVHKNDCFGISNGTNNNSIKSSMFVDSGALPRSLVLGIPRFHDLSEVISNSTRICLATHYDERCVVACVTLSIALALMLQDDTTPIDDLLKTSVQYGLQHSNDEGVKKEFHYYCMCSDYKHIGLSEVGKACHPFKACAAAFTALRQGKDFKTALTSLLMLGGYSSMTGCISGSLLGCKFGYSQLPRHWIEGLNPKNRDYLNSKINALLDMMGLP